MTASESPAVSATEPDWSRERRERKGWSPGRSLLAAIRDYQAARGPLLIRPDSLIGPNCLIFQQVTIGYAGGMSTIGDHARIGANAVVLSDVPAGRAAVGIPVRIVGEDRVNT